MFRWQGGTYNICLHANLIEIYFRGNFWHQFKPLKVKTSMDAEDKDHYNFLLSECCSWAYRDDCNTAQSLKRLCKNGTIFVLAHFVCSKHQRQYPPRGQYLLYFSPCVFLYTKAKKKKNMLEMIDGGPNVPYWQSGAQDDLTMHTWYLSTKPGQHEGSL